MGRGAGDVEGNDYRFGHEMVTCPRIYPDFGKEKKFLFMWRTDLNRETPTPPHGVLESTPMKSRANSDAVHYGIECFTRTHRGLNLGRVLTIITAQIYRLAFGGFHFLENHI